MELDVAWYIGQFDFTDFIMAEAMSMIKRPDDSTNECVDMARTIGQ